MTSAPAIPAETPSALATAADGELLRRYVQQDTTGAEAFTEIVRRYLNLVFSAALRRVNGDHALAEDVAQMVFADFATKARGLQPEMPLGGWLHRHTGFVSAKLTQQDRRRKSREQTAATMHPPTQIPPPDQAWEETAPVLDAAMDALPASDRDALVLRYFEQKNFRSVGEALGLNDDAAQKKVSRALEKLRADLSRRGIVSPAGALASLMALYAASSAPNAVAGEISTNALATAAAGGRSLWNSVTTLSTAARWQAAALVLAGVSATVALTRSVQPPDEKVSVRSAGSVVSPEPSAEPPPPVSIAVTPQLSTQDLVSAAGQTWLRSKGLAATSTALGLLSQISQRDLPAALEVANGFADATVRSLLKTHLLNLWAETSPTDAIAWVNEHPEPNRADLNQNILDNWAAANPDALQMNVGKSGSFKVTTIPERVTATLFRTLAQRDLSQAFLRLAAISSPNDRGQALRGIMETVQNEADRERILSLIETVDDNEIRLQARRGVVEHWAGQNPLAAAAYVARAEPAWERLRLMDSLGLTWLQSDPKQAAAWWIDHAPGSDTLVKIVNVWTQHDANAAGEWLRQQPADATSDAARMTFARQICEMDPESALRWAETITETEMRDGSMRFIYALWKQRDAAASQKFLDQSDWSADRISKLNQSP